MPPKEPAQRSDLRDVQSILHRLESVHRNAWGERPKLDAKVAILRAEVHDRIVGLILEGTPTLGTRLARRYAT